MANNPFNPNFGIPPVLFLDREEIVNTVSNGIKELSSSPYQTTLIYGTRGYGKTVLLNDICGRFSNDKKWIVVYLSSQSNILLDLTESLARKSKTKSDKTRETLSVSVSSHGLTLSAKDKKTQESTSYKNELEAIFEKIQKRGISVLIAIDEVANTEEVRRFVSVYNVLKNQKFPIALLMTGLPKNISELQNEKVLTFLLRSARVNLDALSKLNIKYSYKETFDSAGIEVADSVLTRMTQMTNGYPYAFQLLGYLLWELNTKTITDKTIDKIAEKYRIELYKNVYTKIYSDMTRVEKEFVTVMAHCSQDEVETKYLVEKTKKTKGYVSTYRRRLIDDQVIESTERGFVKFTLPYFKDFIIENEDLL